LITINKRIIATKKRCISPGRGKVGEPKGGRGMLVEAILGGGAAGNLLMLG